MKILKSTGHPELLDSRWLETIKGWQYRPYEVKDTAVPFCYPLPLQVHAKA